MDYEALQAALVEKVNLSVWTFLRRVTRLALRFSKRKRHLEAAGALFVACYNFCRIRKMLRVTPAMEAKLTDRVWTVVELISQ